MILKFNKIMDIYIDPTKDESKDLPTKETLFCNIVKTITPICENTIKNQQFSAIDVSIKSVDEHTAIESLSIKDRELLDKMLSIASNISCDYTTSQTKNSISLDRLREIAIETNFHHIFENQQPQNNETFVVSALRYGNDENHSYNVAVFTDVDLAIKCANEHKIYRGGKYECIVEKFINNKYDEESAIENNEIIYKTF